MVSFRTVSILTFVLASSLVWEECYGQGGNQRRRQRNRNLARTGAGLPSNLLTAYENAFSHQSESGGNQNENAAMESESIRSGNDWADLAPSTPASNAVECSVEVITTLRQGGRCTRLGGVYRPYICQSGAHFAFKSECEQIIAARHDRRPDL